MKILSIGCLRDTLTALKSTLSSYLPEVILHTARSGPKGLEIARTADPAIILLDIASKKPCAYSICRKLKDDDRLSEIPVVFMTPPGTDRESRTKALEAGAEGFLSVPFDEIELTVMIRTMARIKAVTLSQGVQIGPVASANADRVRELELELAEHKFAEEALRQREDMFRIAAESVSNLIWDWHIFDGRLEWHGPVDDLLGYTPGEFPRTLAAWEASIHEEDRSRVMADLDLHLAIGEPYREEYRVRRRDGSYACWTDKGSAIRDSSGKPIRMIGACEDITDRKIAQDALQRSESLLNEMDRMAKVGGWEIDLLKNELSWTEAVHEIYEVEPGYQPTLEAAIDFYTPEAVPVISEALRHTIEDGTPFDLELQLITARKKRLWVRAIGQPIRENGKIVRVRGMFQDINERRLAEDEIRNHRDHLEELVNARTEELIESRKALVEAQAIARVGNWEWDAIKDEIIGSEEFFRLFDVTPEEITRFSQFIARLHPDDRERVQHDVAAALGEDLRYDTDYRVKLRDGGWREINARGSVFTDADGTPIRMSGTCLDITERKASEADLRVKNQVFEDSIACQSIADKNGIFTHVNPAFLRMWGYAAKEEAIGGSVGSFFANPEDSLPVLEALAAHDAWDGVFRARRTDGSTFLSHGYATSLRNSAGELTGYQSTNLDVTSIREAEQQLKALNESLQRSNQELEQFAYVASHDLQEPLRMVSSFTQLLAERYKDVLDQDGKEFIQFAVDGANRMQRLIQDLLAYARVTTRGLTPTALDSYDALGEAIFNLQTAIEETSALVTNGDLPEIQGDRTQIVQVFQNLVGNGIKFHKRGEPPRVHVTAEPNADQPGFCTFKVVDNGIGIEPRHFDRLFVIFQRLHIKQDYPGTGIGLALCKRIVERHSGKIWLESKVGGGSTVFFTLPSAEQGKEYSDG